MADQPNKPATAPPPDWAYDWGRVPFDPNAERAAFNATTNGPAPMTPRPTAPAAPPANTSGWQPERGLGPQPGIDLIDRMCVAADRRERQQAQQPDLTQMAQALMMMQTTQTQMMQVLAALALRLETKKK
jgi:hypothetical protein